MKTSIKLPLTHTACILISCLSVLSACDSGFGWGSPINPPKETLARNAIYISFYKDATIIDAKSLGYQDFILAEKQQRYPIQYYILSEGWLFGNDKYYLVLPLYVTGHSTSVLLNGVTNDTIQCDSYKPEIQYDEVDGMVHKTTMPRFTKISFKKYEINFAKDKGITYLTVYLN